MIVRSAALLLLLFSLDCFSRRRSPPPELFYRPPGTQVEIYKDDPVSLGINVYPAPPIPAKGAVLFIHGGGWRMPGTDMPLFADWEQPLRDAGLRAFSIEHRVAPEYRGKELVEDCIDAVEYIHRNAERYKIPADKIALIGFSSGGHLSVMSALALTRRNPDLPVLNASYLKAVVAFYAPLDLPALVQNGSPEIKAVLAGYVPRNRSVRDRSMDMNFQLPVLDSFLLRALSDISPMDNIHPGMPPTLLIHGDQDTLVPVMQSMAFYSRAVQTGSPVLLVTVPGAAHNFNQSRQYFARRAEQTAIDFIVSKLQ
ncbi:MAG: alpha/beta hydrolase [Spirochaetia bacterium]|nr:alpha/beta hydrolase [Spirochaetia bacterium]